MTVQVFAGYIKTKNSSVILNKHAQLLTGIFVLEISRNMSQMSASLVY